MICKSRRKEIFDMFFSSVIRKNLKQGTTALTFAEDSWNEANIFLYGK